MKNNRDLLVLQAIVAATRVRDVSYGYRPHIVQMAEICANNILIMHEFDWDVLPDPPITAKEIDAVLAMRVFDAITSGSEPPMQLSPHEEAQARETPDPPAV